MTPRSETAATALLALACSMTIAWHAPPPSAPSSSSPTPTPNPTANPTATPTANPTSTPNPTPPSPSTALAARLAIAQSQLSPAAVAVPIDDTFGLVGFPGPTFRAATDAVRASLAALYHDRFVTRPTAPVVVYVFSDLKHEASDPVTYDQFCLHRIGTPCPSPYGFYEQTTREIFATADATFGTLTHEIVHPIVESDFPKAPVWFDECLASLYEAPVLTPPDGIHATVNWRLKRLAKTLASAPKSAAMAGLFGMSDKDFEQGKVALHYATARYTCQWLDHDDKLWPFYRAWRNSAAADPTGEAAFAAVVGTTPAEAEKGWETWVLGLGGR